MNVPEGAKVFALKPLSKEPANAHGHHGAESQENFVDTTESVGMSLGTEEKSEFTCLDIDRPDLPEAQAIMHKAREAPSRVVKTPHGYQFIWKSPPGMPSVRSDLKTQDGIVYGQLLTHGYVVTAGSKVKCDGHKHPNGVSCGIKTYVLEDRTEPPAALPWVVGTTTELEARRSKARSEGGEVTERKSIPLGQHDKAGADTAYNLRRWQGYSEDAIRQYFDQGGLKGLISLLEGYRPEAPFTKVDSDRWAASAVRAVPSPSVALPDGYPTEIVLEEEEDKSYEMLSYVGNTLKWWVRGFVPQNHFLTLYGEGGTGKSTWGSWLVSEITGRGAACATFSVEENPDMFVARAVLSGADRNLIFAVNNASSWVFPRDKDRLEAYIKRRNLKFVWFDSLFSHFEHVDGVNAATAARTILGPLEELARKLECTIMGVFHENKAGSYLGTTEIKNVSRVFLHATRKAMSVDAPLVIKVTKTNMPFRPDKYLNFKTETCKLFDPLGGETQTEEIEPGKIVALNIQLAVRVEDSTRADEEMENVMEEAEKTTKKRDGI